MRLLLQKTITNQYLKISKNIYFVNIFRVISLASKGTLFFTFTDLSNIENHVLVVMWYNWHVSKHQDHLGINHNENRIV